MLAELNLIGIIVAIIIAIAASILKRKQPDEEWDLPEELKPKRPAAPPRPKMGNWEEELRRVLSEQPTAPPVIRGEPPPLPAPREVVYQPRYEEEGQPSFPERALHHFAGLPPHVERQSEAATIAQRVQEHLHHVSTERPALVLVRKKRLAPDIQKIVHGMSTPTGARAAIIASVILGPPRALET